MDCPSIPQAVLRIQGEYATLPGLILTPLQAQRLIGFDAFRCDAVLGALLDAGVLEKTRDGRYVRRGSLAGGSGARCESERRPVVQAA